MKHEKLSLDLEDNIELIIRKRQKHPAQQNELILSLDDMAKIDQNELLDKLFCQAEACVTNYANQGYKDFEEDREDAVFEYLTAFNDVPWQKIANLYALQESGIDPRNLQPGELALRHFTLLGIKKYSTDDLEKIITGLDHYLNERGRWGRMLYGTGSAAYKVVSGTARAVQNTIRYLFFLGVIGLSAAGAYHIIENWDSIKKYVPIEIKIITDVNEPGSDSKILHRQKSFIPYLIDDHKVNVSEFSERIFGQVQAKKGESMEEIMKYKLPSLNLRKGDLWAFVDDKKFRNITPILLEEYTVPSPHIFAFFELPGVIADQVRDETSFRIIDGNKVYVLKDINKNQYMGQIELGVRKNLDDIIKRFPSLDLKYSDFYLIPWPDYKLQKIPVQSNEFDPEGKLLYFYLQEYGADESDEATIKLIHDGFDRNLRTHNHDGGPWCGVILKYGDCLSNIRDSFGPQVDYDNIYKLVDGKPVKIPNDPNEHEKLPSNVLIVWPLPVQPQK